MRHFAAKLLFQFKESRPADMALCEERIVTFSAASSRAALSKAKQIARRASHSFRVVGGGRVHFKPVGIMEVMELGVETEPGEVWWDLYHRKVGGKRRARLVPPERSLRIFTDFGSDHAVSRRPKRKRSRAGRAV